MRQNICLHEKQLQWREFLRQRPNGCKQNKPSKSQYCERGFMIPISGGGRSLVHICMDCFYATKSAIKKCTTCGSTNIVPIKPSARLPKKQASKRTWRIFFEKYAFASFRCCGSGSR